MNQLELQLGMVGLWWLLVVVHGVAPPLYVYNATIYTMEEATPSAAAFCVWNETFRYVGDVQGVRRNCSRLMGDVIPYDANGFTVLPGLVDSHAHIMAEATRLVTCDLRGSRSPAEVVSRLQQYLHEHPVPSTAWVRAQGWDQNAWPASHGAFPTKADLDKAFPAQPLYLERIDGHALWINSAALRRVPPLPKTDPVGGHIVRDKDGHPTGILLDNARLLIDPYLPKPTKEELKHRLSLALRECAQWGLTGIHDMGQDPEVIDLFKEIIDTDIGNFTLRINTFRLGLNDSLLGRGGLPTDPKYWMHRNKLTVQGVKFFMDGALGSWGAAMLRNYSDKPSRGNLRMSPEDFHHNVSLWTAHGWQVATHAIGDRANRVVIDAYEAVLPHVSNKDPRFRIEHAQIVNLTDIPRIGDLGILASMQPTHATSDMVFALSRLGPDRILGAYAWERMLRVGVKALPFGSDFPTVGVVNPFLGFYSAVTREDPTGHPVGGWYASQVVSLQQAIRGYTLDAAYAAFQTDHLGSIKPGKLGDFVILDRNVFTGPPSDIQHIRPLATFLGGVQVFPLV